MAISSSTVTTSFKTQVLQGTHNFTASSGDTFKIALYTNSSSLAAATATYGDGTATNEVSGSGYSAGGNTLTSVTPVADGTTAVCDFADTSWTSATSGTFTIQFPTADASNAILRLA
jgi:hypothetical protein